MQSYDFFSGTLAPALRASDNPIAIACFRSVTRLPLRPLFSVPASIAFISRSTLLLAAGEYLRVELFFAADFFFAAFFVAIPILLKSQMAESPAPVAFDWSGGH
jgi:hypothetical protein